MDKSYEWIRRTAPEGRGFARHGRQAPCAVYYQKGWTPQR